MTASDIKKNVIVNLLGKGFSAFLSFVFMPCFLPFVGWEGIGLIGVFNLLLAICFSLDFGLGTSLNREIARLNAEERGKTQIYPLIKNVEKLGFYVACSYGGIWILVSSFLGQQWLNIKLLSVFEVRTSLFLMGVALVFQWLIFLYQNFLLGLEKQKSANFILAGGALLRHGGALICLMTISPSVFTFFVWQCISTAIQFFIARILLLKNISFSSQEKFEWKTLKNFSINMGGVSLVSIVFHYFDKVFLSRILPLDLFGIYSMSSTLAGGILFLAYPFFYAYLPRFTLLFAQKKMDELRTVFFSAGKNIIMMLGSTGVILFAFSQYILTFWTGSERIAGLANVSFCILLLGNVLFGVMLLSFCLHTAMGKAKSYMMQLFVGLVFLIPTLCLLAPFYGLKGAAVSWLTANVAFFITGLFKIKSILRELNVPNLP
jgi:O-antigen/teichoic acid export membrane protein